MRKKRERYNNDRQVFRIPQQPHNWRHEDSESARRVRGEESRDEAIDRENHHGVLYLPHKKGKLDRMVFFLEKMIYTILIAW